MASQVDLRHNTTFFFQVKQPMFGANYVKGDVISEPDGMFRII